jgi:hypothetical protein
MAVSEDFASLTGRFWSELLAYCYRMLGSAKSTAPPPRSRRGTLSLDPGGSHER